MSGGLDSPAAVLKALHDKLPLATLAAATIGTFPEAQRQQLEVYQRTIEEFSARTLALDSYLQKLIQKNQDHLQAVTTDLDERHRLKAEELQRSVTEERGRVQQAQQELDAQVTEFETRESKYVRRDLLKRMQEKLAERSTIELSEATVSKRRPVTTLCVAAIGIGLGLVGLGTGLALQQGASYWTLAPATAGTLISVTTLVYFTKWTDQWFRRHADAEFHNMQFENDILRASWLAELLFEWDTEKAGQFPTDLVRSFSRYLFDNTNSSSPDHPSEALARLVDEASSIKVGKGAFEVSKPPRGSGS
jgi:hypothetical protein